MAAIVFRERRRGREGLRIIESVQCVVCMVMVKEWHSRELWNCVGGFPGFCES